MTTKISKPLRLVNGRISRNHRNNQEIRKSARKHALRNSFLRHHKKPDKPGDTNRYNGPKPNINVKPATLR